MSEELKPCPFCGGQAEVEQYGTHRQSHVIACMDCGGRLETGEVNEFRNRAWNTRTESAVDKLQKQFKDMEAHLEAIARSL